MASPCGLAGAGTRSAAEESEVGEAGAWLRALRRVCAELQTPASLEAALMPMLPLLQRHCGCWVGLLGGILDFSFDGRPENRYEVTLDLVSGADVSDFRA